MKTTDFNVITCAMNTEIRMKFCLWIIKYIEEKTLEKMELKNIALHVKYKM